MTIKFYLGLAIYQNEIISFAFKNASHGLKFKILDPYMQLILFGGFFFGKMWRTWKISLSSGQLQPHWGNTARQLRPDWGQTSVIGPGNKLFFGVSYVYTCISYLSTEICQYGQPLSCVPLPSLTLPCLK